MADLVEGSRRRDSPPIPAWDDVIHIRPRYRPTREEFEEVRRAELEHREPRLTDEALRAIEQRAEMIDRIRNTQVPEWRQRMVKVVTTLDNVQDQVATIAWLASPILKRMGKTGTFLHQVADAFGDALNYAERALAGPSPTLSTKSRRATSRRANARARTGSVGLLQKGINWLRQNQGHLIEAGQASDTWFGVGLSLGAVFGALEETYWRTGQKAYYTALTAMNATIAQLAPNESATRLAHVELAAAAAEKGLAVPPPPPLELYDWLTGLMKDPARLRAKIHGLTHSISALLSPATIAPGEVALLGLAGIRQGVAGGPALAAVAEHLTEEQIRALLMPPPYVRDPISRLLLERAGARFDARGAALGIWAEPERSFEQHVNASLLEHEASPRAWLPADPRPLAAQLVHQLVEANMPATAALLTGDAGALRDHYEPEDQVIFAAIEQHAMPPAGATREQLAGWFAELLEARGRDPGAWGRGGFGKISAAYWRRSRPAAIAAPLTP